MIRDYLLTSRVLLLTSIRDQLDDTEVPQGDLCRPPDELQLLGLRPDLRDAWWPVLQSAERVLTGIRLSSRPATSGGRTEGRIDYADNLRIYLYLATKHCC